MVTDADSIESALDLSKNSNQSWSYDSSAKAWTLSIVCAVVNPEISDGVWGCFAYSAITSLAEADMDMAFEYYLDLDYDFSTSFQKQMAKYLSEEYMNYINKKALTVSESAVGFDLNNDGDTDDKAALKIEYDAKKYASSNGYGGTYLTLYFDEFVQNLQWYIDNLGYADGWTWFSSDGSALSDKKVAAMTVQDKAEAFLEGRYAKSQTNSSMGGGAAPSGAPSGADNSGMGLRWELRPPEKRSH